LQKPFETSEKARIIGLANVYLQEFHDALVNLKIEYFYKLRNRDLLLKMDRDFKRNFRINRTHIALAFNDLFGDNVSTDAIMEQLREITTEDIFKVENIKHSGNNWYVYPRRKDGFYFQQ
jgi:hypothetical protein